MALFAAFRQKVGTCLLATAALVSGAQPPECTPNLPAPTRTWTGAVDANWNNAANWSPVGVPGPEDHVLITGSSDITVTINAAVNVATLQLGADSGVATQTLLNPGHVLKLGTTGLIRSRGTLQFNAGELQGVVRVGGQMNWIAGRVRGGVQVCESGQLALNGAEKSLSSDTDAAPAFIDNHGRVVWTAGAVNAWSSAQITNRGIWQIAGNGVWLDYCCGGGRASFYNYGTLTKSAGDATAAFGRAGFQNYGTVGAETGTLDFGNNSTWEDGSRITGNGGVRIIGAENYFNGLVTLEGRFELIGGNFRNSGRFTGPSPLLWSGGRLFNALTIEPAGRLEFVGDGGKNIGSGDNNNPASVTNRGTVVWNGGVISAWDRAQIYNLNRWQLAAGGTWIDYCCGGDGATFFNQGTLVKAGDTNATAFARVTFLNSGTVQVDDGPLVFPVHSQWLDGAQISGSGGVQLNGGQHYFSGLLNLNGPLFLNAGTYRNDGRFAGPAPVLWTGGRIFNSFTVEPGARLELSGDGGKSIGSDDNNTPASITNRGTVVWKAGLVSAWNRAQIQNLSRWELAGGGTWIDFCCGGEPASFANRGILVKAGTTNDTAFARTYFFNHDTVQVDDAALVLPAHSQWMDGSQIMGSGAVRLQGGEHYFEGLITLNGSLFLDAGNYRHQARFTGPVPVVWNGGRVFNQMTIEPAGRLEILGDAAKYLSSDDNANPASITNRGTVVWNGATLYGWAGAEIHNQATWRLEGSGGWIEYCCGGNGVSFYNTGTLTKAANTNTVQFLRAEFHNQGGINALGGILEFPVHSHWLSGSRLTGPGGVQLTGGNHYFDGLLTLNGPLDLLAGNVWGNGRFTGPVPLTLRGGRIRNAVTIETGGQMEIAAPGIQLSSDINEAPAAITNRGRVNWTSGGISAWAGARIFNLGEWHLSGGDTTMDYCCGGIAPYFDNAGKLVRSGTGTATLARTYFTSPGVLQLRSGDFEVQNLTLAATSRFEYSPGTIELLSGLPQVHVRDGFSLDGTVNVALPAGATPSVGQTFPLIAGGTRSGQFAVAELPDLPDGAVLSLAYGNSSVSAVVTEPCLANGLISWWPGEGNAGDVAGHHPGTLLNGATLVPGFNGQAFSLDGQNDYVSLGQWSPGSIWTLETWARASALPGGRHMVLGGAGGCLDWGLALQDGQWGVVYKPPGGCSAFLASGTAAVVDEWFHLAGTCDGQSSRIYVNGVLMGSAPVESNYIGYSGEARIGGEACCGNYFGGIVDEPAIYDHDLKPEEIAALYQAGNKGRCAQYRLAVLRFSPTGSFPTNVARLEMRFNQPIQTSSFTSTDIQIVTPSGPLSAAAISIAPTEPLDQRSYAITFAALSAAGTYQVTIGPDVLDAAGNPMAVAFQNHFTIDDTGPRVLTVAPISPATNRVDYLDVTFDAPVNLTTLNAKDLVLSGDAIPGVGQPFGLSNAVYRFPLFAPLAAGIYTLTLGPEIADAAGNLMDQNGNRTGGETNDVYTTTLDVRAADLRVISVVVPSLAKFGDVLPVIVTLTNSGTAHAVGPWQNALLLADNAAGLNATTLGAFGFGGSLPPRSSLVITQQVLLPATVMGARWLGVTLDTQQQVVESNRTNNTRFAATSIAISAADLLVITIAGPEAAQFGQNVEVRFTVKNAGTAATLAPWVDQVFLSPQSNSLVGARLLTSAPSSPLVAGGTYSRTNLVALPLVESAAPGSYYRLVSRICG